MRRLLVPLLALSLLVACGSTARTTDVLTRAPAATRDAATARVRTRLSLTDLPNQHLDMTGAVDFTRGRSSFAVRTGGIRIEQRTIGPHVYLTVPFSSPPRWARLRRGHPLEQRIGGIGPRQGLALLGGATTVQRIGTETVDHAATTHYRARIDLRRALGRSSTTDRPSLQHFVDGLGRDTITIEVWLDHAGRLRRLRIPMTASQVQATMTIELHEFGRPVRIEPPPADRIATAKD